MSSFEDPNAIEVPGRDAPIAIPHISDLSPAEIERHVARARAARSAYFAAWYKRQFQSWASVFRRPGRLARHAGH